MCIPFLFPPYRAEKERSQYFGEVNDLRHSLDQTANEKVILLFLCLLYPEPSLLYQIKELSIITMPIFNYYAIDKSENIENLIFNVWDLCKL